MSREQRISRLLNEAWKTRGASLVGALLCSATSSTVAAPHLPQITVCFHTPFR